MVMIQDGPQNTGADKPLRISGEPFKVQVRLQLGFWCHKTFFFFIPSLPHGDCTVIMCTLSPQQAKEMVMELIRDQGFREQRGEYGSRIGGDSLDVSTCHLFNSSRCWLGFLDRVNFAFLSSYCSGSCPTFCSRNCYREKWRNDQENSEWHRCQDSVQTRWASNMTFMK